ncbi:hypothetical protein MZE81_09930, partial [Escherichia coli]|nr:hypothetical protein [Escherichia coli]
MNPVDRPLLDIGLTRLEFLRISGKGLAGLTIAPALLSLLGCKQEDIDSGTVGLINTPKGVLVTQRARCTGCHRCEISCTNFNDGSVGTFGNDSNLLIVFYVQIMPDDFVMQLHR